MGRRRGSARHREKPIAGAEAKIGFSAAIPKWGGGSTVPVTGKTDERGEFTGEGHSDGSQGGLIQKEGYYASWAKSVEFKKHTAGRWQPWNPTLDVVLKKVINPIPMYAKRINIGIPAFGEAFALSAGMEPALWSNRMKKNAVGPRIQALRERLGLSQAELAERLCAFGWQVNASVISKIESHERSVNDTEVLLLADALDVDLNDVFVGAKMCDDSV